MQKLLFLIVLSLFFCNAMAQEYTDQNDPAAKAVLEKMKRKYEQYKTLEAEFTLTIEVPEQPASSQKGMLQQEGEKYRLKLDDRTFVSDGKSVWLYLAEMKEVQINDVEENAESGTITSPKDLLRVYEWNNYLYVLTQEFSENGQVVQQIEFKPTDRRSDFSKIRLTLDKNSLDIIRIKSFVKDGSRYTLTVDRLIPNKSMTPNTFTFSKSDCPDCHFEDLRLN